MVEANRAKMAGLTTSLFIDKSVPSERFALKPMDIGWKCVRINNESAEFLTVYNFQFKRG
jgi:hypothetical protein